MQRKERYAGIISWFKENRPVAESELNYSSPFQLLVAVILSAQCTDKRVNMYTPALFARYPGPEEMARASEEEILGFIKSISFPNSKASHLLGMAKMLMEDYSGEVPSEVGQLTRLPGVGRKTANVIASIIYGKPVIAVDTHVFRVARRLGLSDGKTVEAVEEDLTAGIEPQDRPVAHHWLILHGRYVCTARKPACSDCGLTQWCREYNRGKKARGDAAERTAVQETDERK